VTRTLAAAGALVLATALGLTPALGPIGVVGDAGAAGCTWQRHSKRVVKRVKRDGRVRRVVRLKRWWACDPLASAPVIAASVPPLPVPGPPAAPEPESGPARLSVKALEFSFTLSRPEIAAGEAIVELDNQGEDPHNLNLQLEGSEEPPLEIPEADSLERRSAHFDFAPGTYRLWCSLPQHDEWGMNATLIVGAG
jgi:plastocyanin